MHYQGYTVACDELRYDQRKGNVVCVGNAEVTDPAGTRYTAERIEVTDAMKEAFIQSLTLTTTDGAMVTAGDVRYSSELATILSEASYSADSGRRDQDDLFRTALARGPRHPRRMAALAIASRSEQANRLPAAQRQLQGRVWRAADCPLFHRRQ